MRDAEGNTARHLSAAECDRLIAGGVATGGMQAKLTACTDALKGGIGEVVIAPGARAGVIGQLLAGEAIGTSVSMKGSETRA